MLDMCESVFYRMRWGLVCSTCYVRFLGGLGGGFWLRPFICILSLDFLVELSVEVLSWVRFCLLVVCAFFFRV